MRKSLHVLAIILFYFTPSVNAQTLQWFRTIKSIGNEEVYDLATDNAGYVYVTGMIEYDADFGNNVILESVGSHDIFIAKYDTLGNLIWARRAGGKGGDKAQSISLDGQGAIYIAGEFEDTCYWDTIVRMTPDIGVNNMFVARYDTSGNVQWVRNIETNAHLHTRGYGVTSDSQSNVYVSGAVEGDAFYDSTYLFSSAGDYDCMILKFDRFGNFIWAHRMGGTDSDKSRSLIYDGTTNIYVTGYFSGTADFLGTSVVGRGHTDAFLAKFDTSGTLQWVKQAGDTGFDRGWDVDININGNILMCGDESRGLFDSHLASCNGNTDGFVAAYDNMGNNLWVTAGGGPEDDECKAVSHDNAGNIYVMGDYGGSAIFPPVTYSGGLFAEVYIASYTNDGSSLRWIRNGTGPLNDRGCGIGLDNTGSIYATGNFNDTLHLGGIDIPGDSLYDIFVSKWSSQNVCAAFASVSGFINCAGNCNGTATATSNGTSPFTYSWNTVPVQNTQTATGLCAGIYDVTVTDAFGCSSTTSIILNDPQQLLLSPSSTSISCNGLCNGSAIVTATGESPFSFSWNTAPVQTRDTATGLCAGSYSVIVTDVNGCTATTSVSLTDPPLLQVNPATTIISCNGSCDGAVDAITAGNAPFTYSWNTTPVQTAETATSLCAGTFTVTVTDAAGCTTSSSVSLADPPSITVSGIETNTSCIGCNDGSIDITASGGTGALNYSWSNGANTEDLQNIPAGIYSVCIKDSNLCMVCDTFAISDPASGIFSPENEFTFSVFPNPAMDFITVKMNGSFPSGAALRLFNSISEVVYSKIFFTNEYSVPVDQLSNGIYFLSITNIHSGKNKMRVISVQ